MLEFTLTGITLTDYNAEDLPCAINDIFYANTDIAFIAPTAFIDEKLSIDTTSNVTDYSINIRFCSDINPLNILNVETIELTPDNIINSSIVVHLNNISNLITNDYLLETMSEEEIFKLTKNFKIIFRIFETSSGIGDENIIDSNDIVQNITFSLNTAFSGPFDVKYENIDFLSPLDFDSSQRTAARFKMPFASGREVVRAFYPENTTEKNPLIVFTHGVAQYTEDFDIRMNFLASYGYFCVSLYCNSEVDKISNYILRFIEHFKNNQTKILSGKFNNKVDFTNIILAGLSRGVLWSVLAYQLLSRKSSLNSQIIDLNLNLSDIKALINFAGVPYTLIGDDGLVVEEFVNINNYLPDSDNFNYFKYDVNVPIISFCGFNDDQNFPGYYIDVFNSYGICYDNKLNYIDKFSIFSWHTHQGAQEGTFSNNTQEFTLAPPLTSPLNEEHLTYNNNNSYITYVNSNLIQFLAINCFSNNKLKKLRFISLDKIKQKTILEKNRANNIILSQFHSKNDDILYHIDHYFGLTLSQAGSTGFTFQSPLGFTYDYPVSSEYRQLGNPIFENLIVNEMFFVGWNASSFFTNTVSNNQEDFTGIIGNTYRSLYVPIESNISFGYTFTESLQLNENNYIGLKACHNYGLTYTIGNTLDSNFSLTLFDITGNSETITSKNYSSGFYKQIDLTDDTASIFSFRSNFPTVSNFVFFRAGDFYLKNTSLDLSNINQIQLDFGPDYGSTFAHIAFDEFVVYKEL